MIHSISSSALLFFVLILSFFSCTSNSWALVNAPPAPIIASDPGYNPELIKTQTLKGNFEVGLSGNSKYTAPIIVAPGTAGHAPIINLSYSSNSSSNSSLGIGWRLAIYFTL